MNLIGIGNKSGIGIGSAMIYGCVESVWKADAFVRLRSNLGYYTFPKMKTLVERSICYQCEDAGKECTQSEAQRIAADVRYRILHPFAIGNAMARGENSEKMLKDFTHWFVRLKGQVPMDALYEVVNWFTGERDYITAMLWPLALDLWYGGFAAFGKSYTAYGDFWLAAGPSLRDGVLTVIAFEYGFSAMFGYGYALMHLFFALCKSYQNENGWAKIAWDGFEQFVFGLIRGHVKVNILGKYLLNLDYVVCNIVGTVLSGTFKMTLEHFWMPRPILLEVYLKTGGYQASVSTNREIGDFLKYK